MVKDEQIEFGSAVSQSKMFGMQTDRSVMLLTNQKRILLIDGTEMKLKKDISTNTIKSVQVTDTSNLTIRLVCFCDGLITLLREFCLHCGIVWILLSFCVDRQRKA